MEIQIAEALGACNCLSMHIKSLNFLHHCQNCGGWTCRKLFLIKEEIFMNLFKLFSFLENRHFEIKQTVTMLDFNDFPDCARTPPIREIITKRLIPRLHQGVNILHNTKRRKNIKYLLRLKKYFPKILCSEYCPMPEADCRECCGLPWRRRHCSPTPWKQSNIQSSNLVSSYSSNQHLQSFIWKRNNWRFQKD